MTRIAIIAATALAFSAMLPGTFTQAAEHVQVFVASYGSDSNPCSLRSPCHTFQKAVEVASVDGEVIAIDSAGFGPVTITQSVTIASADGGAAGIQATRGGNAITINAPGANVILRGLRLEGAGVAYNGIVFNSGDSLTVANCEAQNFIHNDSTSGNGILMQPTSGKVAFVIVNTIVSNNGFSGIRYTPPRDSTATANGVIDHVVAANNQFGILIDNHNATVAISDAVTSSGP
jgi:hypothetical protein